MIAVSIVSHGHAPLVQALVPALLACPEVAQILVTRNLPEPLELPPDGRITLIDNPEPRGFGCNHNQAFRQCTQLLFCPLNPDIQLQGNPFPLLMAGLEQAGAVLAAPLVLNPRGQAEDSMRHFPTPFSLLRKAMGGDDGRYHCSPAQALVYPDWVAGMCMLFRSEAYARLGGFDEAYFLYYEDVDICARIRRQGLELVGVTGAVVIHDARRDSHRQWRYLRWHLASLARYLCRHWGRLPRSRVDGGEGGSGQR